MHENIDKSEQEKNGKKRSPQLPRSLRSMLDEPDKQNPRELPRALRSMLDEPDDEINNENLSEINKDDEYDKELIPEPLNFELEFEGFKDNDKDIIQKPPTLIINNIMVNKSIKELYDKISNSVLIVLHDFNLNNDLEKELINYISILLEDLFANRSDLLNENTNYLHIVGAVIYTSLNIFKNACVNLDINALNILDIISKNIKRDTNINSYIYRPYQKYFKDNIPKEFDNIIKEKFKSYLYSVINKHIKQLNEQLDFDITTANFDFKGANFNITGFCEEIYKDLLEFFKNDFYQFKNAILEEDKQITENTIINLLSASLVKLGISYYYLYVLKILKKDINSTRKLAQIWNLNESDISRCFHFVVRYLKNLVNYGFIFEVIPSDMLTLKDYRTLLLTYINKYTDIINKSYVNFTISKADKKKIITIFDDALNNLDSYGELSKAEQFTLFYDTIDIVAKPPYILGGVLILIYIKYFKNLKISNEFYAELLMKKNISINSHILTLASNTFRENFFELDLENYRISTISHLKEYINILIENNLIEEGDFQDVFDECIIFYDEAIDNGFIPYYKDNKNKKNYYNPQSMAFSLMFYSLRKIEGLEDIALIKILDPLYPEDSNRLSFRTITDTSFNYLYPFIKDYLGRLKYQKYTKEIFIDELNEEIKRSNRIDVKFVYKLYLWSLDSEVQLYGRDLTPSKFFKRLDAYKKPNVFIRIIIEDRRSCTRKEIFLKFKKYIQHYLNGEYKDKALSYFNEFWERRKEELMEYRRKYEFKWIKEKVEKIDNIIIREFFCNFFSKLEKNELEIFDIFLNSEKRASMLKFIGDIGKYRFETSTINDYFIRDNNLIKKIKKESKLHSIVNMTKKIYQIKEKENLGKNTHLIVENYLLENQPLILAKEIPVWKVLKNDKFFTGHIDLIFIDSNEIIILDLKPSGKAEFLKSIPQLIAYAILLKARLMKFYERDEDLVEQIRIKCMGFDKKQAWYFDPFILQDFIIPFLKYEKDKISHRPSHISSRKINDDLPQSYMIDDFKSLL